MQIPVKQFDQFIDDKILERGYSYFKNGHIISFEEISAGLYESIVQGEQVYTVNFTIKNDVIVDYECSCPYDLGPVCKHIAASILYLQKDELGLKQNKRKSKSQKVIKKRKTVEDQVNILLDKINIDELKKYIANVCKENTSFRKLFISNFAYLDEKESTKLYANQIKAIIYSVSGKYGFVDWSGMNFIDKSVSKLLGTAIMHKEEGRFKSSMFIAFAVIEELFDLIGEADDSGGGIYSNISLAFDLLYELTDEDLPEDIKSELYKYCITNFKKQRFIDWEWHVEILNVASRLINSEKEANEILNIIDNEKKDEHNGKHLIMIKYNLILKLHGKKEAEKIINENINVPDFRIIAIEDAISNENYEKAAALAIQGIKNDEKLPGLVLDWYEWLLKISMLQNESEKIIEYAKKLLIDSYRDTPKYYQILKDNVAEEKWKDFIYNVIDEVKKEKYSEFYLASKIYIYEKDWNRLMGLIKENISLRNLEDFEQYLSKDFSFELAELYEEEIMQFLKNHADRNHYKEACRYMRRMVKLGARAKVDKMIDELKVKYKQRRALLEEMSMV
ncbi:MAG: hypothetical protein EHM58_16760 [Ignavibacteriae bacterium]|nr:MAG: hypothetical protein EHM58_16760 [Ignavibacteriota bacterium]